MKSEIEIELELARLSAELNRINRIPWQMAHGQRITEIENRIEELEAANKPQAGKANQ